MANSDTIRLLQECDAGTRMAVNSIDEILEKVQDDKLKTLLQESKEHHKQLELEIHEELEKHEADEKEPGMMANAMSWMKTNVKLGMDNSDSMIADLLTDGCDMGIKSLYKYKNEFDDADKDAKVLCEKLILIEEKLEKELHKYL